MTTLIPALENETSTETNFNLKEGSKNHPLHQRRREVKFALPETDIGKLQSILRMNCNWIHHGGPVSDVHSLYFDDALFTSFYENIEGHHKRKKNRLRWYNNDDKMGHFFFEVKHRDGAITEKNRVSFSANMALDKVPYPKIRRALLNSLPEVQKAHFLSKQDPVLLISYKREYYVYNDIRVTLDYDITSYPQISLGPIQKKGGVSHDNLAILEVKMPTTSTFVLQNLLFPLRLRASKSSKYVLSCQSLAYVLGDHLKRD